MDAASASSSSPHSLASLHNDGHSELDGVEAGLEGQDGEELQEEEKYLSIALADFDASHDPSQLSFLENDRIWILDQSVGGFIGRVERTGSVGELRLDGGFRSLDMGNYSSPQQRAHHRSTLYKENLQRLRQKRVQIQEELQGVVNSYDELISTSSHSARLYSPPFYDLDQLYLTSMQLDMLMVGCDEALQNEQLAALATTNILRPLSDLIRDLLLEESTLQTESHSTITAASLYERFENVRLKMSISMSATTELSEALRGASPSLRLLHRSLSSEQVDPIVKPSSDTTIDGLDSSAASISTEAAPTAEGANVVGGGGGSPPPVSVPFSVSRRRRADAIPSRAAIDAAFEEMSQQMEENSSHSP
eukprot:TRINITY_DN2968_c0_g1_i1.p1 TRINITY_DN2968_c0_g1~~TRINITY_DN2968_c0_g1_i1.p1  ORF type:complete len:391 (-),score=43.91 TRINITY_DN2968_c0_g1_i1:67-1158(-)